MKKIGFILFAVFLSFQGFAQQPDTAIAVITYAFSHVRDTNNISHPYTENMNLFLGKHSSVYKTADKEMIDSITMANFKASGGTVMAPPRLYTTSEYFFYPETHQFFDVERYMGYYIIQDEWPNVQWKISPTTKMISNLKCQKATGEWRGRIYEVWFCADLPYHLGPWKLNGLPGLIVEASDSKQQVIFKFAGYRSLNDKIVVISLPSEGRAKKNECC